MRTFIAVIIGLGIVSWCGSSGGAWGAEAPQTPPAISGKVVDGDGQGVAGAEVAGWVVRQNEPPIRLEATGEARTNADGTFSVPMKVGANAFVAARKEGLAIGWQTWRGEQPKANITIALAKPTIIEGTVVDAQDKPIVGAEVRPLLIRGNFQGEDLLPSFAPFDWMVVHTDMQGQFSFKNAPPDICAEFLVQSAGKARVFTLKLDPNEPPIPSLFKPGQEGIKIVLPAEARIEGQVVEEGMGKPVAGVALRVISQTDFATMLSGDVMSGADGRFIAGGLSGGTYGVALAPSQGKASLWIAAEELKVEVGAEKTVGDIKVQVTKAAGLEVKVLAADTCQPVERATVQVKSTKEDVPGSYVMSDAQGIAHVQLPPGQYVLESAGPSADRKYAQTQPARALDLVEGKTEHIEVKLAPAPKVSVLVRDPEGKPVAGAKVRVLSGWSAQNTELTTDATGRVELMSPAPRPPGWGEDQATVILCRVPERALAAVATMDEPGPAPEIKLAPAVTLTGLVTDAEGKALAGVPINIELWAAQCGFSIGASDLKTDIQGRYEVKTLPAGQKYMVQMNRVYGPAPKADGAAHGSGAVYLDLSDSADCKVEVDKIVLAPADCTVSGTVADAAGKPVAKAQVQVMWGMRLSPGVQSLQPQRQVMTDDQGRFKIEGLCRGNLELYCFQSGAYGVARLSLTGDASDAGDVKIIVWPQGRQGRAAAPEPPSLVGKAVPALDGLGLDVKPEALQGKKVLICFWDYSQRPSRHAVEALAARAAELEKQGVVILCVRASDESRAAAVAWIAKVKGAIVCGEVATKAGAARATTTAEEAPLFPWGVRGLPWLILTDAKHVVVAEGFDVGQLDEKLK
jgi:hypothetical protein